MVVAEVAVRLFGRLRSRSQQDIPRREALTTLPLTRAFNEYFPERSSRADINNRETTPEFLRNYVIRLIEIFRICSRVGIPGISVSECLFVVVT
jgi:hypothetical protein